MKALLAGVGADGSGWALRNAELCAFRERDGNKRMGAQQLRARNGRGKRGENRTVIPASANGPPPTQEGDANTEAMLLA